MTSKIHIIRHSLTEANEKMLYCGFTDLPLSPGGRKLAAEYASAGGYPSAEGCRFYTSGLKRAEETLQLLYGDVPHEILPDMREMNFGIFEMHSYEELKDTPRYQTWIADGGNRLKCPGGESGEEFRSRVLRAFDSLLGGGNAVVFCHGGAIAAVMTRWFPKEERNIYEWQPKAVSGYTLIIENGIPTGYFPIPSMSAQDAAEAV